MNTKLSMEGLGRMSREEFLKAEKIPLVVVLDNIRSGLNVGSLFRSSDAFRLSGIICCGYTPVPPHREVLKSALGATETVQWSHQESTLDAVCELKQNGFMVFAIEQTALSKDLETFEWPLTPVAIVLGNEVSGVDQAVIDECHASLEIAQHGTKHSLNVAVCGGIVLYELHKRWK